MKYTGLRLLHSNVSEKIRSKSVVSLNFTINIKSFTAFLIITAILLAVISMVLKTYFIQHKFIVTLFDLDAEMNIPTFFSSTILMIASFLFFNISRSYRGEKFYFHWLMLGCIFSLMSLDEFITFHEQTSHFFRGIKVANYIHFAWIIPAFILVIIFVVAYLRFFLSLPLRYKMLFFLSAFLYLFGAMGMETIGGFYQSYFGQHNIIYYILTNIEECFEMAGIILLINSLLHYIKQSKEVTPETAIK